MTLVILRAPCGCVRVAAPNASLDRQRYYRIEAKRRGYRYETHTGPDAQRILRETWTCGEEHCAFQAAVRAEEHCAFQAAVRAEEGG